MKTQVKQRKKPTQSRSKFTVDAILEASTHILLRDGYEKFNTNKIAERAGVSIGSLYQYFPNKKSLIVALWQNNADKLREKLIEAFKTSEGLPLKDAIAQTIQATYEAHLEEPKLQILLENLFKQEIPYEDRFELETQAQMKIHPMAIEFLKRYQDHYREGLDLDKAVSLIGRVVQAMMEEKMMTNTDLSKDPSFMEEQVQFIKAFLTK